MAVKSIIIAAFFLLLASSTLSPSDGAPLGNCRYDQLYQLGDSISDTGNLIRESPVGSRLPFARNPYGVTFPSHKATGRCSNGLLMIDFFAKALGLPLLNPIKDTNANFKQGANFAVAGATALRTTVLAKQHVTNPVTNSSLIVQLGWMKDHFKKICHNHRECEKKLQNALFMVGEIGGNDYNYAYLQYFDNFHDVLGVKSLTPLVVRSIKNAIEKVISFGAKNIVVPGEFPMGCHPVFLTKFGTRPGQPDDDRYDENHCLYIMNEQARRHNDQLKEAIDELQKEYPDVKIAYADYYNAFLYLLQQGKSKGFELQKVCCGEGGRYNFNMTRMCGYPGVKACENPDKYVNWDGVHLTQEAYGIMADWLLADLSWKLNCH